MTAADFTDLFPLQHLHMCVMLPDNGRGSRPDESGRAVVQTTVWYSNKCKGKLYDPGDSYDTEFGFIYQFIALHFIVALSSSFIRVMKALVGVLLC